MRQSLSDAGKRAEGWSCGQYGRSRVFEKPRVVQGRGDERSERSVCAWKVQPRVPLDDLVDDVIELFSHGEVCPLPGLDGGEVLGVLSPREVFLGVLRTGPLRLADSPSNPASGNSQSAQDKTSCTREDDDCGIPIEEIPQSFCANQ